MDNLSPCNKVCKLDNITLMCKSCLRTRKEIAEWSALSNIQKYWVLDDIALVRSNVYKFDLEKSS